MNINYRTLEEIEKIASWLEDEESRMVYRQRALYSLTGDKRYIYDIIKYSELFNLSEVAEAYRETEDKYHIYPYEDVLSFITTRPGRRIIIFGCGNMGREMYYLLQNVGIAVDAFCDNRQKGQIEEKEIIAPGDLVNRFPDALILVASYVYEEEMFYQIKGLGIPEDNIFYPGANALIAFFGHPYFDKAFFAPQDGEIFVDGGCYGVETTLEFMQWCPHYSKVYAFEPDRDNYKRCLDIAREKDLKNFNIFNAGLWSEKGELSFAKGGDDGTGSHIEQQGSLVIQTETLDNVLNGETVTYIKLDIEGAELEALKGARETICNCRPKLAVCLYHKPADIYEIPLYIKQLVPEYHMAVRHYTTYLYDTILYCWV